MSYKEPGEPAPIIEVLVCPMCGWHRTKNYGVSTATGEVREVRFDKVDVEHAPLLRLRRMSGKGRGSKDAEIVSLQTKTLAELDDDIKEQIRSQCQKILAVLGG